jgi:hypothetical protein
MLSCIFFLQLLAINTLDPGLASLEMLDPDSMKSDPHLCL